MRLPSFLVNYGQEFLPKTLLTEQIARFAQSEHKATKNTLIYAFMRAYGISLQEYARTKIDDYTSFNDFFTRELADGARTLQDGLICPADGTVSQIGTICDGQIIQAKGRYYSLAQLLADNDTHYWHDGDFATIYLAPHNYHRVHMPFDGVLQRTRYIGGSLFSVNHATAQSVPDVFARNERLVCFFECEFGQAVVILVGAMIVGGIETVATGKITRTDGIHQHTHNLALKKGDELGRFYLGSTAIVIVPKGVADFNAHAGDIVRMGQSIGKFDI